MRICYTPEPGGSLFSIFSYITWKWEFSYLTCYKEWNSKSLMCLKQESKPPSCTQFSKHYFQNTAYAHPQTHRTANLSPLLQPNLSCVWSLHVCLAAATACQQAVPETVTMATAKWEFLQAHENVTVITQRLQDRSLVSTLTLFFIAAIIQLKHSHKC